MVDNILQITTGTQETPNARDWIPCWGVNPWSYDGQWLLYQSQIGSGSDNQKNEICIIKADGTGYQKLTNNSLCDTHGNFTPNGNKIVFQRGESNARIYVMDRNGSNQTNLTDMHSGPVGGSSCENKPLVSPDGTKIAFHTCTEDIWVMNIDGTNPVNVSGSLSDANKHSWSPDSQWILFSAKVSYSVNTSTRIFKVRPTGANLTMLSENVDNDYCENWAAWSPNGNSISYHKGDNNNLSQLWIMGTDGTNKRLLVSNIPDALDEDDEWVCGPHSWSPDSKYITFKRYLDDDSPIFIINVTTEEITQLTDGYRDGRMWWGPDGTKILFKEYSSGSDSRDGGLYNYDLLVINLKQTTFEFDVNALLASLGLLSNFVFNEEDDDNSSGKTVTTSSSNKNCFIATAAFGSPVAGQVEILRQFRDKYLLTNALGKNFVAWYYNNGPIAANWIKDKPLAKVAVQMALYPLIGFSFLLIGGYLPFVTVGFLLSTLLFMRFRPKKIIDI